MESESGKGNGKDAVKQASRFLSKLARAGKEREEIDTKEGLALCLGLAQNLHQNDIFTGTEFTVADCAAVKGIIELIVRWGIRPYLLYSPSPSPSPSSSPSPSPSSSSSQDVLLTSCNVLGSFALDNLYHKGFCVSVVVRNYYLPDVMAGFLQLGFAPHQKHEKRRSMAVAKLEEAVAALEVGDMVETFLVLVGQRDGRSPPPWLKHEAGKILSRLVIKDGGVPAVMHRLLGAGIKGDVQVYSNVAAHLAKVPKSVTSSEDYYRAVCAQILPFLSYQNFAKNRLGEGKTAQQILQNMHHTSSLLACNMIVCEPELSDTYLFKPILVHLVKWCKLQTKIFFCENMWIECEGEKLTETSIIQSLMQIHTLLTAGHKEAKKVRKQVLEETRPAIPALMMLHYLLETSTTSKPFCTGVMPTKTELCLCKVKQGDKKGYSETEEEINTRVKQNDVSLNEKRDKITGLRKGFLDGHVSQTLDEDDLSPLGRLKIIINDLMIAHVCELPEDFTHLLLDFLSDLDVKKFRWPSTEGDIWNALNVTNYCEHTPTEYLSRLLLACERWSLVVRLMGEILSKIFHLQQSLKPQLFYKDNDGEISPWTNMLQIMQSFETLNEVVGSKALQYDSIAASTIVQNLLNEQALLNDEDMVMIVLHMVHNVLNGFSSRFSEEGLCKQGKDVLICISSSLENFCCSQSLTQKVKTMSSTLNTRICSLLAL
ncbi:uncharacterized protein LOC131067553 isoform X1 [Cryptomeria japonica]|uniref:uncharacterized protein LOC131067553 isoform X1 n=1 Tax=Cryptomeria japonica TaxID=3369 RepID=UPI0027DA628A|nr:uncharacterized protein LOC131067553 isoform X1 [Cryptomeria japonica]